MKEFLEKIRKPKTGIPLKRQLAATVGIILLGVALGVLQKWLDATAANTLPLLLQRMDIGNYFGRLAIWFLLGTAVSVYSASPLRAGINTLRKISDAASSAQKFELLQNAGGERRSSFWIQPE